MATQEQKNASDLGEQAIALAEQLGRIAGTIEGTAESWQDPARAPGKKRRGPAPSTPGLKKSDETIPKARLAEANRQRRKSYG